MKKWIINLFLISVLFILANKANSQFLTQTYLDPCDNKIYVVTFTIPNQSLLVVIRNESRVFTYSEAKTGAVQLWATQILSKPCPTVNTAVQQTIASTISQAAASAAASAASSAASAAASAASSAASGAASSAAGSAVVSVTPSASTSSPSSSTSSSSSSSSQSSSSSGESSSSSSSSESSGGGEQKSESSSESKSESKEEKKSESKEEKKKEEKKEEKKQARMNPIMVNSDLTLGQQAMGGFTPVISLGTSQSSATGESSWGLTSMIYADLKQLALSASKTNMIFKKGVLTAIKSYSYTIAYIGSTNMSFGGYTWIRPHPKLGTYGYNLSVINVKLKGNKNDYSYSLISSATSFWTKPYKLSKKLIVSPGVFLLSSPYSYNTQTGSTLNYNITGLVGAGFNFQISKRFALALDYKLNASTTPDTPILSYFMVGSRTMF